MPRLVESRDKLNFQNSHRGGSGYRCFIDSKRLAHDTFHDQTASNALGTDANLGGCFAGLHPERLQVWAEPTLGDTGCLATVTAKVLRLTAFDFRVTSNRLLSTD